MKSFTQKGTARPPVHRWKDAPDAEQETCAGTKAEPGCGKSFGVVARYRNRLCGRDRCPHCKAPRRIPDSLRDVATQWAGLIPHHVKQATAAGIDVNAAEDAVTTAFVKALLCWVPSRAKFSTVAYTYLRNAVARVGQDVIRRRNTHAPAVVANVNLLHVAIARRGGGLHSVEARDTEQRITEAMAKLQPRSRKILRLRFGVDDGKPRTLAAIARRLKLTKARVQQIEVTALNCLRSLLDPSTEI